MTGRVARALAVAALFCSPALAMQIHHQPLDSVLEKTRLALVAEIRTVSEPRRDGFWVQVDLTAAPVRVLFGSLDQARPLACTYAQGLPHRRGKTDVSPLVSGSGLEFRMKEGDRVILLVSQPASAGGACTLLRVEPLENEKRIHPPAGKTAGPPEG
jgi:hypothetical protein